MSCGEHFENIYCSISNVSKNLLIININKFHKIINAHVNWII